jgi:hypothetical protein
LGCGFDVANLSGSDYYGTIPRRRRREGRVQEERVPPAYLTSPLLWHIILILLLLFLTMPIFKTSLLAGDLSS